MVVSETSLFILQRPRRDEGHRHCSFCQKTVVRGVDVERQVVSFQGPSPGVTAVASACSTTAVVSPDSAPSTVFTHLPSTGSPVIC